MHDVLLSKHPPMNLNVALGPASSGRGLELEGPSYLHATNPSQRRTRISSAACFGWGGIQQRAKKSSARQVARNMEGRWPGVEARVGWQNFKQPLAGGFEKRKDAPGVHFFLNIFGFLKGRAVQIKQPCAHSSRSFRHPLWSLSGRRP